MYNYFQLTLFLVLIMKLDQKSIIHPRLTRNRPYKSRVGPKRIANMVLNSRKWYYLVSMYKYYQVTIFLNLIRNFDQKSNFQPRLVWTRPYKSRIGPKRGENLVFKWYYIVSIYNLWLFNLFLILIGKFNQKSSQTFSPD